MSGTSLTSVDLELKTSGGAENGKSVCRWGSVNEKYPVEFWETGSDLHKQTLTDRPAGEYNIFAKCVDAGGNIAKNSTSFELKQDTSPPKIVRVYFDGSLKIITDEDSECAYSFKNCGFDFDENVSMMSGIGKTHSAEWTTDSTYYIKCRDSNQISPGGCSIVVRAYNFI